MNLLQTAVLSLRPANWQLSGNVVLLGRTTAHCVALMAIPLLLPHFPFRPGHLSPSPCGQICLSSCDEVAMALWMFSWQEAVKSKSHSHRA